MKKRQDSPGADASIPSAEMQRTELQARQIDLETQNEELLQARDLLEESRDRYIDFYDFSPVGYLTLSPKALINEINLTGAMMLGEERSQLRRRRFAEFLALEDNDFWNRHFMAARQHEGKLSCELRIHRGDGSRMDVQIDSLRLASGSGEPVVRLALTDITERKRAEAALRASEAQRRLLEQQKIIQTSLDGFWVARAKDARILETNEAFCNMVGYSRAELLTMCIPDLEADESPDETAAHIKKIMAIGYDRFETRHRHKQGHLIALEVSVSYSESDGGVNFVFVRNITERKFAEQYERFRSHILELLSGGDALPEILEGIVRGVEQLSPAMICSILLLEGNHLGHGIAPSLPDFYNAAIEGIEIGIGIGSCGTAAASGERVIVADIQTHPYWAPIKELAAKAGVGACWSQPIRSSVGQVLGTFAIYHQEAHTPTAADLSIIEQAAHLASIAIERKQAEQQLKQSLEFSEGIISAIPDILFEMDRSGTYLNVWTQNPELLAAQKQALLGKNVHEVLSPEAAAATMDALREADEKGTAVGRDICIDLPQGKFWFSHSLAKKPGNTSSAATFMVLSRDITGRKQSEALLMQRERELRTFAENMPDNIVRYNREGATIYVNPALKRTLGDFAAAMLGTTPREYHPDGSYEDYAQLLDSVLASGEAGELEKMQLGSYGDVSVHQIRMVPERGENGEVVGVLSIGRDITERKRMEESLVSRERELRALAESSPGMMGSFYLRPDGRICMPYVSSKIWGHFGLMPQDVAVDATPLLARTHPDDAQMVQDSIAESARSLTSWHKEYRILHPAKGVRWMESNTNPEPCPDGGVIWYGNVHDITERKVAEETLRASEQKYRTLAENFPDILIRYDREARRTYVNPAMERVFAVPAKQTMGLTPQEANPVKLPEIYQNALKHTLATGERSEFEMELPVSSGGMGIGFITIAAERDVQGEVCGAISIGRDITKLKQAEQQLRELTMHLQSVREEEKAGLAREIHDDLGSTLAALKLKLSHLLDFELAGEMKSAPLFARLESMSFILEHAIAATRRIITDMRPDVLDNLGLFAALKWQAEQFHKYTGIMCRIVCANDRGCVDCRECAHQLDKTQSINLFRIFQEALTNVARHSGAACVVAEYRPGDGHVLLSIRDDGCGLPEGHVPATTSFGIRGMRERVGQLGGEITFENALGGGLCVTVRLPLASGNQDGAESLA
jgi:PAS domain S-box-containing protein